MFSIRKLRDIKKKENIKDFSHSKYQHNNLKSHFNQININDMQKELSIKNLKKREKNKQNKIIEKEKKRKKFQIKICDLIYKNF